MILIHVKGERIQTLSNELFSEIMKIKNYFQKLNL